MTTTITVAQYLKARLEELGLDRMFGVAGNYTAPLLDTILADECSPIEISGNPNEICAGFAADAYARYKGIGAVYVTYSVGAFTALNTIAGSYTEQVPVLLINGAPTNKEYSNEVNAGLLYSHTTGYQQVDIHMFRPITAAAERITDARQAPYQIDSALTAMLTHKRPAYLEVGEDVWRAACRAPEGELRSGADDFITVSEAEEAAQAAMELFTSNRRAIVWAGMEIGRFGLEDEFLDLLDAINGDEQVLSQQSGDPVKFVTSALSKSVISERHPLFEGCVTLSQAEIETLVGDDGCVLGIGTWTTSKDTHSQNIRSDRTVLASHGWARVGAGFYPSVDLRTFIVKLAEAFRARSAPQRLTGLSLAPVLKARLLAAVPPQPLCEDGVTYDDFFDALGGWITEDDVMVVDAGFPLIGAQSVPIPARGGFVAQAAWLSIGYSVPAATGIKCANPQKRVMVVVGDGAFHETCQAVSDHHHYGHNTVVFVLANGLYGIEQFLVNPNPFREPPVPYSDKLLNKPYAYNELPKWKFDQLGESLGGEGRKASTPAELARVLAEIRATPERNFVVEVTVPTVDIPRSLEAGLGAEVGEDEIENPAWPPAGKF